MYPYLPASPADLVPLPRCDGPKLKPFDFQGPQKIEFLDYIGEGIHAHVFKIKILGQIHALKLVSSQNTRIFIMVYFVKLSIQFRFVFDDDWLGPDDYVDSNNLEAMSALYNYSEPFSCECRAFGRLQEAGHDELAVQCQGYLLLDEEHERAMRNQFSHLDLRFEGNIFWARENLGLRSRFSGRGGRPPPIRGIVKEFGAGPEELRTRDARRILRDVVQLQQLGIIHIDVADRQLINGKLCDFSKAITVPHFVTTPELNPQLTPEWISAMEFETFQFSINDYWEFDDMVRLWNEEHETQKNKITFYAFPGGGSCQTKYNLRRSPSRERVYSFVDPRQYNWRMSGSSPRKRARRVLDGKTKKLGQKTRGSRGAPSKGRLRLDTKPPRWYLNCSNEVAAELRVETSFSNSLQWECKDGLIFPRKKR